MDKRDVKILIKGTLYKFYESLEQRVYRFDYVGSEEQPDYDNIVCHYKLRGSEEVEGELFGDYGRSHCVDALDYGEYISKDEYDKF